MSKTRLWLRIAAIAIIAVSSLFFAVSVLFGILSRISGDGTIQLFGGRFAAVEIAADPGYPKGSLIRLHQGSIPENTPVAVRTDGVLVISDSRISNLTLGGKSVTVSRDQILGSVDFRIGGIGWLLIWVSGEPGFVLCLAASALMAALGTALMLHTGKNAGRRTNTASESENGRRDPLPELDFRIGTLASALAAPGAEANAGVKTLVITQTRAASSAIRSQKGEVRIFASGQEKVIPLNIGRRVVNLGGYTVTVDIVKSPERTEDVTKELPVIRVPGREEAGGTGVNRYVIGREVSDSADDETESVTD